MPEDEEAVATARPINPLNIGPVVVCGTALSPGPEQLLLALMDLRD